MLKRQRRRLLHTISLPPPSRLADIFNVIASVQISLMCVCFFFLVRGLVECTGRGCPDWCWPFIYTEIELHTHVESTSSTRRELSVLQPQQVGLAPSIFQPPLGKKTPSSLTLSLWRPCASAPFNLFSKLWGSTVTQVDLMDEFVFPLSALRGFLVFNGWPACYAHLFLRDKWFKSTEFDQHSTDWKRREDDHVWDDMNLAWYSVMIVVRKYDVVAFPYWKNLIQ